MYIHDIHVLTVDIYVRIEVEIHCPYEMHAKYRNRDMNTEIQVDIKAKSHLTFGVDFIYVGAAVRSGISE